MGVRGLLFGVVAVSLVVMVSATSPYQQAHSGTASFYTKSSRSACYGKLPANGLYAAASRRIFKRGGACGQKYKITCVGKGCISNSVVGPPPGASGKIVPIPGSGGPITVTIVDVCASCKPNQFALSLHAFSRLADPDIGTIRIRYQRV